jgi:hypothetical protein
MADVLHEEVWKIINGARLPSRRTKDSSRVRSLTFKGLPFEKQKDINDLIEKHQFEKAKEVYGNDLKTVDHVRKVASDLGTLLTTNYKTKRSLVSAFKEGFNEPTIRYMRGDEGTRVVDSFEVRNIGPMPSGPGFGGASNPITGDGVHGIDPSMAALNTANIWISPQEATTLYSQKGIFEMVIRKKSQSILLNGVKIKNPKYSPDQLKKIAENQKKKSFDRALANAVRDSLVYGGATIFPMFKKDNPATTNLDISLLARLGVVGKDCIDYFVALDRWNMYNIPNWNPTAKDYMQPKFYFVPFLGSDVSGQRTARIVTAPQAGYWGNLMTLGFGISDFCGYVQPGMNYRTVINTVPTMIRQMSILAREINIDGSLATEGSLYLDDLMKEDTIRFRDMSALNPIQMDVVGQIKAIQRDFKQVPELIRLIRQDYAANAGVPEELIWSSERGAFSSGDTTDSAYEKQSEGIRFMHREVADQCKNLAKLMVIDALGLDRDVLRDLDYTYIEFDEPKITNAKDRSEITATATKGVFDLVASGLKAPTAAKFVEILGGNEFELPHDLIEEIQAAQDEKDAMDKEQHDAEIKAMAEGGARPAGSKKPGDKKGHSYTDPLEQRKHEKVGAGRKQGLAKARNKAV